MSSAIPLISEAIASIVKHGSSERFKKECTDLVKVCCEQKQQITNVLYPSVLHCRLNQRHM